MTQWIRVVTEPLGLAGFALFLVFGYLAKAKSNDERRWLSPVAVALAVIALAGGLAPAYVQATKPATQSSSTGKTPQTEAQQTNKVEQSSTGPGSPNVQGVQGDVNITVDQGASTVVAEPVPIDFAPKYKQGLRPGCTCNRVDITFPGEPYSVGVNQEFLFRYDANDLCYGQSFNKFDGIVHWGPRDTTMRNTNGVGDYPGIAGTLRTKLSKPDHYNVIANITVDCYDIGCVNTCRAKGTTVVAVK